MKVVKESSDELNPAVVTTAYIERAPRRRRASDYAALGLASCGVGYLPVAPGTWGSLVGVGLFVAAGLASGAASSFAIGRGWDVIYLYPVFTPINFLLLIGLTLAGVWAATRCEAVLGRKDPGVVVIDEVVGQLIALAFVRQRVTPLDLMVGFAAFRLFDIWKPYPIRRLESLESGLGIMADDVVAGFYAAAVLSLVNTISVVYVHFTI